MKRSIRVFIFIGISLQTGSAQTPESSPTPLGTTAPSEISSISRLAPASVTPPSDSTTLTLDYLYNRKPQDGSVAQALENVAKVLEDKEKALDVLTPPGMDDPILRDQFETYLNLSEVPADRIKRYVDKIGLVSELLKTGDVRSAEATLQDLSDDQTLDARVSRELALQVESLTEAKRAVGDLDNINQDLWDRIVTYGRNIDQITRDLQTGSQENESKPKPLDLQEDVPSGNLELANECSKFLDARIQIRLNDIQSHYQLEQAKSTFASYVTTLFSNHRYDLVILAANFYRNLCPGEDCPTSMNDEVDASLANNQQVDFNLQAFQHRFEKGELANATNCLEQAFIGSPCRPGVQGIPLSEKQRVSDYLRHLDVLKSALEACDFGEVQEQVIQMQKIANDVDSTRPLALVKSAKFESNFHLSKARLMAQQGNLKEGMAELQSAADYWTDNPDLSSLAESFFNSADLKSRAVNEFDQLVKEQNYRAIFERQIAMAAAIRGDVGREQQLGAALEKVKQAEVALDSASRLTQTGNLSVAWERIDAALSEWPEDVKLNRMLTDLSAREPEFASAISRAREAEAQNELGYSLTWYTNAQTFYPESQIASQGVKRISQRILASGPAN